MEPKKPYFEGFFICVPDTEEYSVYAIRKEIHDALVGITPEITIHVDHSDADYGLIAMVINRKSADPALEETLYLKKDARWIVEMFRHHFRHHTGEEES